MHGSTVARLVTVVAASLVVAAAASLAQAQSSALGGAELRRQLLADFTARVGSPPPETEPLARVFWETAPETFEKCLAETPARLLVPPASPLFNDRGAWLASLLRDQARADKAANRVDAAAWKHLVCAAVASSELRGQALAGAMIDDSWNATRWGYEALTSSRPDDSWAWRVLMSLAAAKVGPEATAKQIDYGEKALAVAADDFEITQIELSLSTARIGIADLSGARSDLEAAFTKINAAPASHPSWRMLMARALQLQATLDLDDRPTQARASAVAFSSFADRLAADHPGQETACLQASGLMLWSFSVSASAPKEAERLTRRAQDILDAQGLRWASLCSKGIVDIAY